VTRPLRIALNATAAVSGGGVTYWANLLPALAALRSPHEFHVLVARDQARFDDAIPPSFRVSRVSFARPRSLGRLLWDQTTLPRMLRRDRIDVLLAAADVAPLLSPCPVVLGIQNANPYYGPAGSSRSSRFRESVLRWLTARAARRAHHVYFISEDSRRRISEAIGIPSRRTSVVYLGIAGRFFESAGDAQGIEAPAAPEVSPAARRGTILSVSAVRNHKDFETLLAAVARLKDDAGGPTLTIAGAFIDPPYLQTLRRLTAELGIEARVDFLGEVAHSSLPGLYRRAGAFVLPTLVETFGQPLVEAMASGVAVVATDLDITREICGKAASYYPAGKRGGLARGARAHPRRHPVPRGTDRGGPASRAGLLVGAVRPPDAGPAGEGGRGRRPWRSPQA
jgi:glycosyltransferase involved in cell wall biosynthesis